MEMFGNKNAAMAANSPAAASVEVRMQFLKKVYGLLTFSILLAAVGAYIGRVYMPPGLMLPLMIGGIFMTFGVHAVRRKPGWNVAALLGFTTMLGFIMGPVMNVYQVGVIQEALVLTALIFGGLTLYVMTSKRDFSFLSGFLFTGLLIIIGGSLLNMFFFQSPMGEFIIAAGGVFLFSGFILYDTSNILRHYDVEDYTSATLALYLDVLNLFLFLLRLLGGSRN